MKNIFLAVTFAFNSLLAQEVPKVSAKMKFADIQLTIDADAQAKIQKKVNSLMQNRIYYNQFLERCNLYFPFIEKVFKEQKLPEDFKFLAIQESTLNPDAVSRSNAVGFWQFKDFTAKELGLRVDPQIDERKNIVSSSRAAAKYLKKNHYFLKNWIYTTLSYNLGLTGANQLLDRKYIGAKKLTLTKNTHNYIIHFLANRLAFKSNLGKGSIPQITLYEYQEAKGKTLDELTRITTLSRKELESYNRWLQSGYVPLDKEYSFLLPIPNNRKNELVAKLNLGKPEILVTSVGGFDSLKDIPKDSINKTQQGGYPILTKRETKKIGDQTFSFITANGIPAVIAGSNQNIGLITKSLHIPKKRFLKYNDLTVVDALKEEQIYYLRNKKRKAKTAVHVTQPNQTIWQIAQMYGIKLKKLLKKNRLASNPELKQGRILFLQKKRKKTVPIEYKELKSQKNETDHGNDNKENNVVSDTTNTEVKEKVDKEEDEFIFNPNAKFHQVRKGEGLFAIARLYQITAANLIKWNDLDDNLDLTIGQILQVKENVPAKSTVDTTNNPSNNEDDNGFDLDTDIPNIDEDGNITNLKENTDNTGGVDSIRDTESSENLEPTNVFHVVEKGETLYRIARKYQVSMQQIQYWNGYDAEIALPLGTRLIVGKKYPDFNSDTIDNNSTSNIKPDNTSTINFDTNNNVSENTNGSTTSTISRKTHIIVKGEGLWSISQKYNVSLEKINKWNNLAKNVVLKIGQKLFVAGEPNTIPDSTTKILDTNIGIINPSGNTNTNSSNDSISKTEQPIIHKVTRNDKYHIVQKGEGLWGIGRKYGVSAKQIQRWNNITGNIKVGQKLIINNLASNKDNSGNNISNNSNSKKDLKYHVVKKGESLWGITRKYGVSKRKILVWNKLSNENLTIGQKLIVGNPSGKIVFADNKGNSNQVYHTIKKGEGLWGIAKKYGVTVNDIKRLNTIEGNNIKLGQRLRVK